MESRSIFCPRCGASNTEKVKFCRQCGLSMAPVTGYLTGELTAGALPSGPNSTAPGSLKPHSHPLASFSPRQKMALSIILAVTSPALFAIIGLEDFSPLAAILMPFVIVLAVFYFRNQDKQLRSKQLVDGSPVPTPVSLTPPSPPLYIPPPPSGVTLDAPLDTDRKLEPPPFGRNPSRPESLPGSVTEEETRKLSQPT